MGQPGDHFLPIPLLDLAVLVRDKDSLAVSSAPDINAGDYVTAANEPGIKAVAAAAAFGLAIREILKKDGESSAVARSLRPPDIGRQAHAVLHRDPSLLQHHVELGRRRIISFGAG
jgi:hypothetical protein